MARRSISIAPEVIVGFLEVMPDDVTIVGSLASGPNLEEVLFVLEGPWTGTDEMPPKRIQCEVETTTTRESERRVRQDTTLKWIED